MSKMEAQYRIDVAARMTNTASLRLADCRDILNTPAPVNRFGVYVDRAGISASIRTMQAHLTAAALLLSGDWPGPDDYKEVEAPKS
jgi:hypothetical protein